MKNIVTIRKKPTPLWKILRATLRKGKLRRLDTMQRLKIKRLVQTEKCLCKGSYTLKKEKRVSDVKKEYISTFFGLINTVKATPIAWEVTETEMPVYPCIFSVDAMEKARMNLINNCNPSYDDPFGYIFNRFDPQLEEFKRKFGCKGTCIKGERK